MNVDDAFVCKANEPDACYQWSIQNALAANCKEVAAEWVRVFRAKQDVHAVRSVALRCFADATDKCKQKGDPEPCLKRHYALAVAQLLAGENARQSLSAK